MKRTVSLALALAMVLSLFCVPAFAATTVASGTFGADGDNLTWVLDNEGTLTISGEGEMGNTVPWQSDRNEIKSVVIEDGVTNIGFSAFEVCSSLTSITIPDSVTSIGGEAFYDCSSLTSITIPDSVTSIGEGAFVYCSSLTSITIPDSVTSIGNLAFRDCSSL
ncbi:MAG: leucine-rich repeat domain-containing protein, partial [Clostridia bacterium]|nr:leucine-rich repeat domain-containing protein [Clostridia bacterium]